jgi:hypothetical protein
MAYYKETRKAMAITPIYIRPLLQEPRFYNHTRIDKTTVSCTFSDRSELNCTAESVMFTFTGELGRSDCTFDSRAETVATIYE